MTLADLIRKAKEIGDQFNTHEIPLVDELWCDIEVDLEAVQDTDDKYYIQMTVK